MAWQDAKDFSLIGGEPFIRGARGWRLTNCDSARCFTVNADKPRMLGERTRNHRLAADGELLFGGAWFSENRGGASSVLGNIKRRHSAFLVFSPRQLAPL
jgi:hypothetical protein